MSDWGAGFAIGIAVGFVSGLAAGRKQKSWSELTEREKRIRMGIMGVLAALVVAGVVALLLTTGARG